MLALRLAKVSQWGSWLASNYKTIIVVCISNNTNKNMRMLITETYKKKKKKNNGTVCLQKQNGR